MASTDARPLPKNATALRVYFPLRLTTGALNSGATGLDSEVSKDGAAFADCTNEATEIGSTGIYYLDLTSSEVTANCSVVQVKSTTTNAQTQVIVLYPVQNGTDIPVDMTYVAGSAVSTSSAQIGVNVVNAGATAWGSGAITAASIASGAITNAKFAAGAIDAAAIAADAIGASELASDAVTEIANAVWDTDATSRQTAGTFGKAIGDPLTRTNSLMQSLPDAVSGAAGGLFIAGTNAATTVSTALTATFTGNLTGSVGSVASGGITAASIATGAVDADALAADAVDEILDEIVEGSLTLRQAIRIILAALAGKITNANTSTNSFRDVADTKNRIVATVDSTGRTAVTLDGS